MTDSCSKDLGKRDLLSMILGYSKHIKCKYHRSIPIFESAQIFLQLLKMSDLRIARMLWAFPIFRI